jgi:HSP20 family protein
MSLFDDDPFEEIVREFFGGSSPNRIQSHHNQVIKGEDEDRKIDFVEDDKKIYLIFELPGYNEQDISVSVKGKELVINASKSQTENIQRYLTSKLKQGSQIKKTLPKFINPKKFNNTIRNGVLEVVFNKR